MVQKWTKILKNNDDDDDDDDSEKINRVQPKEANLLDD